MQAAKGKGGPTSHRYRPASEYDDATLAQKREYWRNKKREQRARLSERRRKPALDSQKQVPYLQGSDSASSPPSHTNSVSLVTQSKSRNTHRVSSTEAANDQNEARLMSANAKGFQPTSCSVLAPAAEGEPASVKCPTARSVSCVLSPPTSSGTQQSTSSSVPPVTQSRITNGSSIKTEPQPCVSMQGRPASKTPFKAPVSFPSQPMVFLTNITTDMKLTSSRVSCKTESKTTTPQSGSKSALVTTRRAGGGAQRSSVSEEEKAARRREHWRIKKREQRAKLAAQIAKVKVRTHSGDGAPPRLTAQKTMASAGLPSQMFLRGMGQRSCPVRDKVPFTAARHDSDKLQGGSVPVVVPNLQTGLIKAQTSFKNRIMQPIITTCGGNFVKKPESQRKQSNLNYSVTRAMIRSKTPRQKLIETQKSFLNLRNLRCKSPLMATVFTSKGIPKTDLNDSPEQVIAKRREYWRLKKREQRAKLSLEVKTRAREKDSLMRRVKRYQQILAELRRTRAMAHSTGSALSPVSETIGGFIKEDGTLTINIPPGHTYPNTAGGKKEEDIQMTPTQHRAGMTKAAVDPVRTNQSPPSLRLNQRKVSFPLTVQPVTKMPRLLLIKPHLPITTAPRSAVTQSLSLFSHSPPSQNVISIGSASASGPVSGSCVMKMAISSCASSLLLSQDAGLTEEEKMAKKREYWRIKKREQRAARAVRLKHSMLQVRTSAALLRRRAQRQELATTMQMSLTKCTENMQPLHNNAVPTMPHANKIKQESKSVTTADLNSPSEQAICPDIKPPTSPPASPGQQLEPDPSLSADSQATTLLAVASMKKLLEESLSCVAECQTEQLGIQIRMKEDASELDVKPSLSELLEKNDIPPVADVTLRMKSWEPGSDDLSQRDSSSPKLKNSTLITEMLPSFPTCGEMELFSEPSSQPLSLTENQTMEASSSPSTAQRFISNNSDHQELRHLPATSLDHSETQQELRQQEQGQNNSLPPAQRHSSITMEPSGLTSLQRKREYWKLMKRQQRARLRARQKTPLFPKNNQVPGLIINTLKDAGQKSNLSISSVAAVSSIPRVLVVSQTGHPDRSPDTLQVKPPITSRDEDRKSFRTNFDDGPLHEEWKPRSPEVSPAPARCALRPPDNPLSSIHLQPVESPGQTPHFIISPIKPSCSPVQSPADLVQPPTKLAPQSTMVPPKPVPGESEENFLRRKREYWRIKKKEQRARKAIKGKEPSPKLVSNDWRSVLPVQDLQDQTGAAQQDSGDWLHSSEDSEHLNSMSVDPDQGAFTSSHYTDASEPLFADYNGYNEDEGPPSEELWRSRYLMDYDPLNQLLVCMVCGELQYSHSLEGVRVHIDEAHPHTQNLEPRERQQILEAWDEQVSQRERFFTSQLQQHSGVLAETFRN